jgi:hypothetical protein
MLQQENLTTPKASNGLVKRYLRPANPARPLLHATVAFAANGSARSTPRTKHGIAALLSWAMKMARDSRFGLSTRWSYEVMSRIHR